MIISWNFFVKRLALVLDALIFLYILSLVIDIFSQFEQDRLAAWQALQVPIIGEISLILFIEIASRT